MPSPVCASGIPEIQASWFSNSFSTWVAVTRAVQSFSNTCSTEAKASVHSVSL